MNGRERFMTALQGGIPDRVPLFEYYWNPAFIKSVLGEPASPHHIADDEVAMSRALGIDMVYTAPYGFTSFTSIQQHGEKYRDEWGTEWGTNADSWPGAWTLGEVVTCRDDWQRLAIPDPAPSMRMDQPRRTVELAAGELAVIGGVRGPLSAASILAGLVNICMWIYDDPDLLHELLGAMGRWNTELGLRLIETGVDAVIIHDDWGMNQATYFSPDHWKEFIRPHITAQVDALAATGTPIILHSDGNLNVLMEEIAHLKICALNPLQRSAEMDLAAIKASFGSSLCLIGNVSATTTLPHGTPETVEQEVLECLRDAAPGGGYILAPDHSYHSAVPSENIRRALDTCRKFGAYPLDLDHINARINQLDKKDAT